MTDWTLSMVRDLDRDDQLADKRGCFELPRGVIYLDGNSLGPLPRGVAERLNRVVNDEWRNSLIRGWNDHGWMALAGKVGEKLAPLIGAEPGEVICGDSTSVNLFKLLSAALKLRPDRKVILTADDNFPTDIYIAEGLVRQLGGDYEIRYVDHADPIGGIDQDVAVVSLTHVDYRTGFMLDMAAVTAAARDAGAVMLWDLSHSTGAMPVELNAAGADLAVGCGYKFLNGGPGAPAYLYVAERHQAALQQPLSGWLGHREPFAFENRYHPADGIARNLCGTPPVISMSAFDSALDHFADVDLTKLRAKSMAMGDLFVDLVERDCAEFGLSVVSPRDANQRGSQVCLRHEHGYAIMQALIDRGVIGDFRAPDVLRFGFAPLYLSYEDVWQAIEILRDVMASGDWDQPEFHARAAVT